MMMAKIIIFCKYFHQKTTFYSSLLPSFDISYWFRLNAGDVLQAPALVEDLTL